MNVNKPKEHGLMHTVHQIALYLKVNVMNQKEHGLMHIVHQIAHYLKVNVMNQKEHGLMHIVLFQKLKQKMSVKILHIPKNKRLVFAN